MLINPSIHSATAANRRGLAVPESHFEHFRDVPVDPTPATLRQVYIYCVAVTVTPPPTPRFPFLFRRPSPLSFAALFFPLGSVAAVYPLVEVVPFYKYGLKLNRSS